MPAAVLTFGSTSVATGATVIASSRRIRTTSTASTAVDITSAEACTASGDRASPDSPRVVAVGVRGGV